MPSGHDRVMSERPALTSRMIGPYDPIMRFFMSPRSPLLSAGSTLLSAAVLVASLAGAVLPAGAQGVPRDHPSLTPDRKAPSDRVPAEPGPGRGSRAEKPLPGGGVGVDLTAPPAGQQAAVTLEQLFERLKTAKRPEAGQRIAREIEGRWLQSGSDTVDLLMARALAAIKANDTALALDLLDAIVTLKPDYAEGWNKRATVHFVRKDIGRSVADIEAVLRLEPRHYGALYGLATLMKELGDKKRALAAYRQALALNPFLSEVEKQVKDLSLEVDGRDL
jgi:hypothetical protein